MHELICNLHMHTVYSDGTGSHQDLAEAAAVSGLDVLFVTDHNVLVKDLGNIYDAQNRKILMVIGEEIHDRTRDPQKNHLLVIGADRELSQYASDPRQLMLQSKKSDGITIIAHPFEDAMPSFHETDITWTDWGVNGFTGMELWNGLSELKTVSKNLIQAVFYAFFPNMIAEGPSLETLSKWDDIHKSGKRCVGVGGSDSHALIKNLGPIQKIIFPYEFHFKAINTHLIVDHPLTGDYEQDRNDVLAALRNGHAFVGYDIPASTRGFRFHAHTKTGMALMGDEISLGSGVTIQVKVPFPAECVLIRNGDILARFGGQEIFTKNITEPGVYRVECYQSYLGKRRGWIFSNPIYIRE